MQGEIALDNLENALRQVRSVSAVRISANAQGDIDEVHVLAAADRNAKQIVRDIESVLWTQFGLDVDHKKISIAQVNGAEGPGPENVPRAARPRLVGVSSRTLKAAAEVTVQLAVAGEIVEGTAQGPGSARNQLRLFVEATLRALAPLLDDDWVFVPEDVAVTQLSTHSIANVALAMIGPAGEQSLIGSSLVRNDPREAIVKATLDAVNRKLSHLRKLKQ